ncbi:mevalonate kinase [Dellaglioa algida]|uniref:mevalonate kinase n=1 Tax=Dellaglioa algida TaxID=105612 RepID=UPI0024C4D6B0|nr:mevalonate kinase [Dellaglioa algida]MDK1726411.1 mevalonate kinase [Dellaglioa algida]
MNNSSDNLMPKSIGTSHAKIILIGEHSVVYSQPAIAFPLSNVKISVTTEAIADKQWITSRFYSGEIKNVPMNMHGIKKVVHYILSLLNKQKQSFKLTIESEIPSERGMGSSAATIIAIIRSLYAFFNTEISREELLFIANIAETTTHGSPSGIDAATTSSHEPIWFIKHKEAYSVPLNIEATLVVADTGIKGQTGLTVGQVRDRVLSSPDATEKIIAELGQLTSMAKSQITTDDAISLGHTLTRSHELLKDLGVSHPKLDFLVETSLSNGALGAKLTGGGGGGCMIALVKTPEEAINLSHLLNRNGAISTWIQPLTKESQDIEK